MLETKISNKVYKPTSYNKAISNSVHGWHWKEALEKEIRNLKNHPTWEYDKLLSYIKVVGYKWVFKIKNYPNGTVSQYKTRLMAQRFSQIYRIDLNKTFSPTMRKESFHIFIAISCLVDTIVDQVDIVGAYLKSLLSDNNLPIFIKLLPKIESFRAIKPGLLCRLL